MSLQVGMPDFILTVNISKLLNEYSCSSMQNLNTIDDRSRCRYEFNGDIVSGFVGS